MEICFLPSSLLLSESVVRRSAIGASVLSYIATHASEQKLVSEKAKHPHGDILLAMATFMVHELHVMQSRSLWFPYLATLPKAYTLPLSWGRDRIDNLLGGTPLRRLIVDRLEWLSEGTRIVQAACGDQIPSSVPLEQGLLWSACAVWSRAFPKARPNTHIDQKSNSQDWLMLSEICMYPILDMLNHKRNHRIEWRMHDEGVAFMAVDGTLQGHELFNNYGPKGNEVVALSAPPCSLA
jgi:hypothetical protein